MSLKWIFSCAKEKETVTDETVLGKSLNETVLGLYKDNIETCETLNETREKVSELTYETREKVSELNINVSELNIKVSELNYRLLKHNIENETSLKVLELKHRLNKAEAENKKLRTSPRLAPWTTPPAKYSDLAGR